MRQATAKSALAALMIAFAFGCGGPATETPDAGNNNNNNNNNTDTTAPGLVSGLSATAGEGQVLLTWDANSESDIKGYHLRYGTSATTLDQTVSAGNTTTYTVTGLTNGTTYYFAAIAEDNAGNRSAASAAVSATPAAADSTPPTIATTQPADSSTNVQINTTISVEFSEPMLANSVNATASPNINLGNPVWNAEGTIATFAPSIAMAHSTQYTITVAGSDRANLALTGDTSFSFTTAAPPDTTAPTIVSSDPADNATGVAADKKISITFSEAMDVGMVTVTADNAYDLGMPAWSSENKVVSFTAPAADFAYNTTYTLTVNGKDLAGNALTETTISFTTANPPDTTPPTVANTSPAASAMNVPITTNISFTFSEAMNKASVEGAVTFSPATTGTFLWDSSSTLATFDPSSDLAYGTTYTVTVGVGAQDLAGNGLASPHSFTFTTGAAPDTTPPTITATNPANGGSGAARNTNITVTFSEPMDKASAQIAFAITSPTGFNGGVFTWNTAGTEMTYNPPADFSYGQYVYFTVSNAAKDLAGNAMAASSNRSFRVVRQATMTFTSEPALDGYIRDDEGFLNTTYSAVAVGDLPSNRYYRAFISFRISGGTPTLPANLVRINSATLYAYQSSVSGTPYTDLGNLMAQSVYYGPTLDISDFNLPMDQTYQCCLFCNPFCANRDEQRVLSSTTTAERKSTLVTSKVQLDWTERTNRGGRSQFRLRFPTNVTNDGSGDYINVYTGETTVANGKPTLEITYEYP